MRVVLAAAARVEPETPLVAEVLGEHERPPAQAIAERAGRGGLLAGMRSRNRSHVDARGPHLVTPTRRVDELARLHPQR